MNPIRGNLIYDPAFHAYVDIRSARGQRLFETYSRILAAQRGAPHGQKRGADRDAHGTSKRR